MKRLFSVLAISALLLIAAMPSFATTIVYKTAIGATVGGQPVAAQATFVTSPGVLTITLQNMIVNPTSVIQNISDLEFVIGNASLADLKLATITKSSGMERKIAKGGTYSDLATPVTSGWSLTTSLFGSNNALHLDVLGTKIGPAHTIVGAPNAKTNLYDNANGSIAGNGPHNPFLAGPVIFRLGIPVVTDTTFITAARFSFGTVSGVFSNGYMEEPEPSTWVMLVGGLGMIGYRLRRRSA